MGDGSNRLEVDKDDAIGLGKQARSLWRSLGAQENCQGQQGHQGRYYNEGSACSSVHEATENKVPSRPGRHLVRELLES
jgi:hypothetical protein